MNDSSTDNMEMKRYGHYELLDCIGRGGMGLVYRARDTRLGRIVAIKCLRAELYEPAYRERFRREAMLLAKLNHPNIVQIYDYIETDDQLALVMEYVDGQNLQVWVREHLVSLKTRLLWLSHIAAGLAIAHDAGIIHRDLKAENILLTLNEDIKISDLGIARSVDSNLTIHEYVAGSYCSMSPEQAMGEELDFRSDLFSLGILAYQLLCDAHPFGKTDNKLQLMQRIISHPPIPPQQVIPDLPADVCDFLLQLLSKNIDKRPPDTRTVAVAFAAFAQEQPDSDSQSDDTELLIRPMRPSATNMASVNTNAQAKPVSVGGGNRRFTLAASLALLLGAVSVLGFYWWPAPAPRYLAVVSPVISASDLDDSHQAMVRGAVYDALRQSAVQLDGYYLIPPEQTEDIDGDYESIQRATGADELLTADVRCRQDSCTISLSRLEASDANAEEPSRLRVKNTRSIDVLRDQYLPMADMVQTAVGHVFSRKMVNGFEGITEEEYASFIEVSLALRTSGASDSLLQKLDSVYNAVNRISALRALYTQIAVDLYYESGDNSYLEKLKRLYRSNSLITSDPAYLYGLFSVQLAESNFTAAAETLNRLQAQEINRIRLLELEADLLLSNNEFAKAIGIYEKLLKLKISGHNYYNLSLAYWYAGDNVKARGALEKAIQLSPSFFKAHRLYGAIALNEGDALAAIESYASILEKKSDDISSISNIGIGHLLNGDYQQAAVRFRQAVELAPHNSTYLLNHADAESLAGRDESAVALYRQVVAMATDPNNRDHLRNRVQALAHIKQFSEAIQLLQLLQRADPDNIDTHYTSAMVYALAGDLTSAMVNVENALAKNLSKIWFQFSWFDSLCQLQHFSALLDADGTVSRCDRLASQ
jgi:tetratricopeptide (TPR) repeat protein/predicted Ser/Thr protein kinase